MIVQFILQNFLSFKEEQVFNFVATNDDSDPSHVVDTFHPQIQILRTAAIYGANGSGKSNLFKALAKMRKIVLDSRHNYPDTDLGFQPCLLSPSQEPTHFNVIIYIDDTFYEYGFIFGETIQKEWLNKCDVNDSEQFVPIFIREAGNKIIENNLSNSESNGIDYLIEKLNDKQLFLSCLLNKKIEQIEPVIKWFNSFCPAEKSIGTVLEYKIFTDEAFKDFVLRSLKILDESIRDIVIKTEDITFDEVLSNQSEKELIYLSIGATNSFRYKHKGKEGSIIFGGKGSLKFIQLCIIRLESSHGDKVEFSKSQESDGAVRFMELLPLFYKFIKPESDIPPVVFIDQLDQSLHTLLCKQIVKDILEKSNGQFIFTTHRTNLIDLKLLRADEIWFTDKTRKGESRLYSMTNV